jgi:hypothetical protein
MGGNRSRKPYRTTALAGVLNLAETPPWNSTLVQIVIGFSAPPTTLGSPFFIRRVSFVDALHDYEVLNEDLAITGVLTNLVIPCRFEFSIQDVVTAQYDNPDGLDVGLELVFEEAQ